MLNHKTQMRTYLTNATLILSNETVENGSLLIEGDHIAEICPVSPANIDQEINLEGDILMPGLIDLHGDAIEREMEPRPKANLPISYSILQGDRKCALAGITTAYHAIGFHGDLAYWYRNSKVSAELARAIHARRETLTVDNRIHCRFEMKIPQGMEYIKALLDEGICTLVALNNHIPGQGQYGEEIYRKRLEEDGKEASEIDRIMAENRTHIIEAEKNAPAMAEIALQAGVPIASHDDETPEKITLRHSQGATISEFPLTFDAARKAKEFGSHAIVGSPNVMRGGSTGMGSRAIDLIAEDLADCLCSDYAPATLLPATFQIAKELGWPLHRAVRVATLGPAQAARLPDRGELRVGKRADIIAVREQDGFAAVRYLWSRGRLGLVCP